MLSSQYVNITNWQVFLLEILSYLVWYFIYFWYTDTLDSECFFSGHWIDPSRNTYTVQQFNNLTALDQTLNYNTI